MTFWERKQKCCSIIREVDVVYAVIAIWRVFCGKCKITRRQQQQSLFAPPPAICLLHDLKYRDMYLWRVCFVILRSMPHELWIGPWWFFTKGSWQIFLIKIHYNANPHDFSRITKLFTNYCIILTVNWLYWYQQWTSKSTNKIIFQQTKSRATTMMTTKQQTTN